MKRRAFINVSGLLAILFIAAGLTTQTPSKELNLENYLYLELKSGRVIIEMRPDLAPNHVKRIRKLARDGFYNDTPIHRVIEGFMAQMGDPTGTGRGGSELSDLKAEFSTEPHVRGTVSMARTPDPDSANSQFFIVFDDASFLDRQYTVWGKVSEGMEFVDKIKRGVPPDGIVDDPDMVISISVAADVEG